MTRTNSNVFGGGTQDNGTLLAGVTGTSGDFLQALGGDGSWMAIDRSNEYHVFGSAQNVIISRHVHSKEWGGRYGRPVTPRKMKESERREVTFARMLMDERRAVWWEPSACGAPPTTAGPGSPPRPHSTVR